MKKLIIIIALFIGAQALNAQQEWTTNIYITDNFGVKAKPTLRLGVLKNATNWLDTSLGEAELPPMHPRGNILHAFVYFPDSARNDMMYSYADYRSIPSDSSHYYREYRLWVQWGGAEQLSIGWDNIPKTVDSAVLTDIMGGIVYKFNMKDSLHAIITNSAHTRFIIKVWLNDGNTSAYEENNDFVMYPLPASDELRIKGLDDSGDYSILDALGNEVLKGRIEKTAEINLNSLPPSVYFFRFQLKNGSYIARKFIKI